MSSLPDVIVAAADGGLGLLPAATDANRVIMGVCSGGPTNELLAFTSKKKLVETLGEGPLVDAVAHSLDVAGGTVYACRVLTAEIPVAGAVTKTGTGPTITVKVGSLPLDDYEVVVLVTRAGVAGVAACRVSLDGGRTYGPEVVLPMGTPADGGDPEVPGELKIGSDDEVTLSIPTVGSFGEGDTYSFTCAAAIPTSVEIGAAIDKVLLDAREWGFLHVAVTPATVADSKTLATAVGAKMVAAETSHRYAVALVQVAKDTDTNTIAAFSAFADTTVMASAGDAFIVSPISGRIHKRNAAYAIGARLARAPIHEDLGRFASGSLPGVDELERDERETPGLDAARFATLRTHIGQPGHYVTSGKLMSPPTSDYRHIQHKRIINTGRRVTRQALMRYLNDTVRVNATTGFILETEARNIERNVAAQLEAALVAPGHASAVSVQVPRDENLISSEHLSVEIRVVPLGYLRAITATVGLDNPALRSA